MSRQKTYSLFSPQKWSTIDSAWMPRCDHRGAQMKEKKRTNKACTVMKNMTMDIFLMLSVCELSTHVECVTRMALRQAYKSKIQTNEQTVTTLENIALRNMMWSISIMSFFHSIRHRHFVDSYWASSLWQQASSASTVACKLKMFAYKRVYIIYSNNF